MKEWKNVIRLARFWWVHCGIEQGWDHDAVHSIRRTRRDGTLEPLMDRGKEGFSIGCEGYKSHVGNGWVGKTF